MLQDSKNDPETNPFKSKYAAREIYQELRAKLEHYYGINTDEQQQQQQQDSGMVIRFLSHLYAGLKITHSNLPWCPVLLLWCPLQSFNTN